MRLALPVVFTCCVASALYAQAPQPIQVRYDWRQQAVDSLQVVRSGAVLRISVGNLNRLCYNYEVTVNQVVARVDLPDIMGFFTTGAIDPASNGRVSDTTKAQRMQGMGVPASEAAKSLDMAEDAQDAATAALNEATASLDAIAAAYKKVQNETTNFYKFACPGGNSRGPEVKTGNSQLANLRAARTSLSQVLPHRVLAEAALTRGLKALDEARRNLAAMERASDPASSAFKKLTATTNRIVGINVRLGEIDRDIKKVQEGTLKQVKAIDGGAIAATLEGITTAAQDTSGISRSIVVHGNTDSVVVIVKARGKDDIPTMKGVALDDPFTIPVRRRHRFFLSAGFMVSTLDEHTYRRENRLQPGNPDSTYSTYVDRSDNRHIAFAPTVLINTTIGEWGSADLIISGGIAARKVADRVSPDFLAGLSLGISDRFVASLLLGMGRVERLLLGRPRRVAASPVSPSVTFESAVGEQWKGQIALSITYRAR